MQVLFWKSVINAGFIRKITDKWRFYCNSCVGYQSWTTGNPAYNPQVVALQMPGRSGAGNRVAFFAAVHGPKKDMSGTNFRTSRKSETQRPFLTWTFIHIYLYKYKYIYIYIHITSIYIYNVYIKWSYNIYIYIWTMCQYTIYWLITYQSYASPRSLYRNESSGTSQPFTSCRLWLQAAPPFLPAGASNFQWISLEKKTNEQWSKSLSHSMILVGLCIGIPLLEYEKILNISRIV